MRKPKPIPQAAPPADTPEQAYAMRVWEGQSSSLPRADRIARVEAALIGQGMTMDAVQLPASDE